MHAEYRQQKAAWLGTLAVQGDSRKMLNLKTPSNTTTHLWHNYGLRDIESTSSATDTPTS